MIKMRQPVWMVIMLGLLRSAAMGQSSTLGDMGEYWPSFLQADKVAICSAEIDGIIVDIKVKPQEFVQQGDVLVQLDDALGRLQLRSTELELELNTLREAALIRYEYAKDSLAIINQLYAEEIDGTRVASERELKVAQQEHDIAKLELTKAEKDTYLLEIRHEQAKLVLDKHAVRAPLDGVIVPFSSVQRYEELKEVAIGEAVTTNRPVLAMMKVDQLRVSEPLPVEQLDKISLGQTARVYIEGTDQPLDATVVYISPTVGSTRQFNVEVQFDNPLRSHADKMTRGQYRYHFRPGQRARVEFPDLLASHEGQ